MIDPASPVRPEQYMRRAIELAREGFERGEGLPFGAVIVKGETVVVEAWNRSLRNMDITAHAEMEAIRDACRALSALSLDGCDMYASAQPCPMCTSAIYFAGMRRVFFGASYTDVAELAPSLDVQPISAALKQPYTSRPIHESRLMVEEARQVFADYAERLAAMQ
jgi:guanine deaminase